MKILLTKNTLFLVKNTPSARNETSHLLTSVLSLPRIPLTPRIGTSHGRLRDFGSELNKNTPPPPHQTHTQNWNFLWRTLVLSLPRIRPPPPELELLMEDLGTLVLNLPRIPLTPPPPELELLIEDCAGD